MLPQAQSSPHRDNKGKQTACQQLNLCNRLKKEGSVLCICINAIVLKLLLHTSHSQ